MAKKFVQPAEGRKPRHETTHRPLDPAGEFWEDTPYLRRRLRDGDVIVATYVDPKAQRAAALAAEKGAAPAPAAASAPDVPQRPETTPAEVKKPKRVQRGAVEQ